MKGTWKGALAVTASLILPLVFYEGLSQGVMILAYLVWGDAVTGYGLEVMTGAAALSSLVLGAVYWRQVKAGERKMQEGGSRRTLVQWLLLVPAASVSCVVLNVLVALMNLDSAAYDQVSGVLFQPPFAVQVLATVLVIPLAEELVFRGFVFAGLRKRMPFWAAALASAVYFGIFHGNLPQGIYACLVGLELALCYEWYGGLGGAWLFHGLVNLTSVVMVQLLN